MNNEAFSRLLSFLKTIRLGWMIPFFLLAKGENPREQLRAITTGVVFPVLAILVFLAGWALSSKQIVTKFGTVPGPAQVRSAWGSLMNEKRLEDIKEQDHLQRQRENRIKYLDKYAAALEQMPGGAPTLGNLGATRDAVTQSGETFDEVNELLEVQNKVSIVGSADAAAEVIESFKFDSSRELGSMIAETLVPQEVSYRAAEEDLRMNPELNPQKDDSDEAAASKESARKLANKELAAEKSKLLIARQQMTTEATRMAGDILSAIPRSTTSALRQFDAQATSLAPKLSGWYDDVVLSEESTGVKFKDKVKLKMLAKSFADSPYPGKDTYIGQIVTSLKTVFFGFFIASAIAIPIGILCGLNKNINTALNPLIQIFKPVSPLAWLPIVMIVVGALYVSDDPMFEISFINSAITVALCSLWPTLVNTAVGVASVDKDFLNVAKVLKLNWFQRVFKVVLPASLPLVFTGLRLSLGVGWMVLIAAEMLAQNPGLGKFVWDMFQNGSSETLSMIIVAVFTIGIIGFLLDSIMLSLQQLVSFGEATV